jgi:Putative Ig domain
MKTILVILFTVLLCFSCSSEKPGTTVAKGSLPAGGETGAPYAVEIYPNGATRNSALRLTSRGFDLSSAKIEWLVNGRPYATAMSTQFAGADAAKGDSIQARAVIQGREVVSNTVRILNTPPEITTVKFVPEIIKYGDALGIEAVGSDVDGDSVTFLYEWTVNGEPAGNGKSIETVLKRGDKIRVKITPTDGEANGRSVIVNREIANWPPVIIEHKEFSSDESVYTYQVKASDPDGDTLTYSMESPTNGLTIDSSTGLLKWVAPPDFKGDKNITVVVADGHGGIVKYTLKFTIQ